VGDTRRDSPDPGAPDRRAETVDTDATAPEPARHLTPRERLFVEAFCGVAQFNASRASRSQVAMLSKRERTVTLVKRDTDR
jgi:hypothetical protein